MSLFPVLSSKVNNYVSICETFPFRHQQMMDHKWQTPTFEERCIFGKLKSVNLNEHIIEYNLDSDANEV
jgi:hypothetical protein